MQKKKKNAQYVLVWFEGLNLTTVIRQAIAHRAFSSRKFSIQGNNKGDIVIMLR